MKTGTCRFGPMCKYHHPRQGGGSLQPAMLNYYGYPLRPVGEFVTQSCSLFSQSSSNWFPFHIVFRRKYADQFDSLTIHAGRERVLLLHEDRPMQVCFQLQIPPPATQWCLVAIACNNHLSNSTVPFGKLASWATFSFTCWILRFRLLWSCALLARCCPGAGLESLSGQFTPHIDVSSEGKIALGVQTFQED